MSARWVDRGALVRLRHLDLSGLSDGIEPPERVGEVAACPPRLDVNQCIAVMLRRSDAMNQWVDASLFDRAVKRLLCFSLVLVLFSRGRWAQEIPKEGKKPLTLITSHTALKSSA